MPSRSATGHAPKRAAAGSRPRPRPEARFRLRVTIGKTIAIGPGKISLLEAIGRTGSLTAAARSIDMSYRRAWLLLDQLNGSLARPAVSSVTGGQHGGGSELTEVGRRLIELYRGIESTAEQACADEISRLVGLLAR